MELIGSTGAINLDTQLLHGIDIRLTRIETILTALQQRLLGNELTGGELAVINGRIKALEEFRWKFAGAMGTALFAYEMVKTLIHK